MLICGPASIQFPNWSSTLASALSYVPLRSPLWSLFSVCSCPKNRQLNCVRRTSANGRFFAECPFGRHNGLPTQSWQSSSTDKRRRFVWSIREKAPRRFSNNWTANVGFISPRSCTPPPVYSVARNSPAAGRGSALSCCIHIAHRGRGRCGFPICLSRDGRAGFYPPGRQAL